MRVKDRNGFTKVELSVVLGVVALLLINMLPAIDYARQVARAHACTSNLRQIGQALHSYHDVYNMLPPAAFWESRELEIDHQRLIGTERDRQGVMAIRQNWVQLVIPFLRQDDLGESFEPTVSIMHQDNQLGRTTEFPLMKCPNDPYNNSDNYYVFEAPDGSESRFARGNYAINGGTQPIHQFPGFLANPVPNGIHCSFDSRTGLFQMWGNGVAGFNKCFSFEDFENDLSTTVLVNEVRAGIDPADSRGVWALGQIGSSVTWAHGLNGDAYGPNCPWMNSDDLLEGAALYRKLGQDRITQEEMPFCNHCNQGNQATSRSTHSGGVNILMADGSVHFVSNSIDLGLWHVMHSRETPGNIFDDDFEAKLDGSIASAATTSTIRTVIEIALPSEPPGETMENSIGMQFTVIPTGTFTMALPDENNHDIYPQEAKPHTVRISKPFYLGTFEVTQQQFLEVMSENPSWHSPIGGGQAELILADTSQCPVEFITWYDADKFCRRLSDLPQERSAGRTYRLPTEAEWEYACRSGKSTPYPFEHKWVEGDDSGIIGGKDWSENPPLIKPVGSFRPNEFGLHDMCGNVFEWTADWFKRDYYSWSPTEDPQGPATGYLKVVRGWYWRFLGDQCHYDYMVTSPWRQNRYIGFRVVCELSNRE